MTGLYFLSLRIYREVGSTALYLLLVFGTSIAGCGLIYYPLARFIRKRNAFIKQRLFK
jgi:hypothetical protein